MSTANKYWINGEPPLSINVEVGVAKYWLNGEPYALASSGNNQGALSKTLAAATLSSAATLKIAALVTKTLQDATLVSTSTLLIQSTDSSTLQDATLSATGVSTPTPITADLSKTLQDATLAATGMIPGVGTSSTTLQDATLSATGVLPIVGTTAVTLQAATLDARGKGPLRFDALGTGELLVGLAKLVSLAFDAPGAGSLDIDVHVPPHDFYLNGQWLAPTVGDGHQKYWLNGAPILFISKLNDFLIKFSATGHGYADIKLVRGATLHPDMTGHGEADFQLNVGRPLSFDARGHGELSVILKGGGVYLDFDATGHGELDVQLSGGFVDIECQVEGETEGPDPVATDFFIVDAPSCY